MENFKLTKPIRLIELFAGIGSQAKALKNIGADFEHYKVVEFDKYAIKSYNAIHGTNFETMDITNIKGGDLEIVDSDKYTYLISYSFPCGLAGTKIKVKDGYKNIENITTQDYVLTHTNTYQKVVKTMTRISPSYNRIKVLGQPELLLTDEHPLYVLRNGRIQWVKVKDLEKTDKVCYNINNKEKSTKCSDKVLWLLGRYVADGHINKYTHNSINFAIRFNKEQEFIEHIPDEMIDKFKKFKKKCWDYRIADEDFQDICLEFGNGSSNKRLPQWVLDLPKEQAKIFLDGYFSGDGHYNKNKNLMMFCTASKELFLGLQTLIAKVYGTICSCYIREDKRKETFNNTYNGQFSLSGKTHFQQIIDNQIFVPIREIEHIKKDVQVFNFEVEKDNSYTCENIVVHNCQDLSVAGKQEGMAKESGTRSGLLWEVERLLNECEELPQVLLMENVPQVHGKKNIEHFNKWMEFLESKGYLNYWQDLNAKDFGIPQNRNRCFMISIRGGWQKYSFPKPTELKLRLKDMLEYEVEEKYFIKQTEIYPIRKNDITINSESEIRCMQIGNCMPSKNRNNPNQCRVYDINGLSPALTCTGGGNRQPMIVRDYQGEKRIRKFTPKEYFRLMGFKDEDFEKAEKVNSNTKLYQQGGNSIVVNLLEAIFKQMM